MIFLLVSLCFVVTNGALLLAVKCTDGIILGTDSFSTMSSSQQSLNQNSAFNSVFPLSDKIAICYVSGSISFYELHDDIQQELIKYKMDNGIYDTSVQMSVKSCAALARRLIYAKYHRVHCIVAGMNGDNQFHIYEILPGGSQFEHTIAAAGSSAENADAMANLLFENVFDVEGSIPKVRSILEKCIGRDHRTKGRAQLWTLTAKEGIRRCNP